jgi:hypothetical protein
VPESDEVAIAQKSDSNNDWMTDKTCYSCNKKGHITSVCLDKSKDSNKDETNSEQDESDSKRKKTKGKNKKRKQRNSLSKK